MGTEAIDLLKPDVSPPRHVMRKDQPEDQEEEDDLEALRLAALRSMKPRKPQGYQLQPHPRRTNLVTIVVDEDPAPPPNTKPSSSPSASLSLSLAGARAGTGARSNSPPTSRNDKFSRYKDDEKSSDEDEEEEDEEEVLKLDASAEVDELTQLLDDLEDKVLKDPKSSHSAPRRSHPKQRPRSPLSPAYRRRRRSCSRSPPCYYRESPSPPSRRRHRRTPPLENGKSKSLPPHPSPSSSSRKRHDEESERRQPRLSTPEREKRIARKKKFQAPLNDQKKVISLKNIKEDVTRLSSLSPPPSRGHPPVTTPLEDAISLSVEDTLDMFDEEDAQRSLKRKHVSLSANASPSSHHKGGIMDLRVQLHKKRQQKLGSNKSSSSHGGPSTYIEEQITVGLEEGEEDALENAVLESSSEDEESYSSHSKKPRRVLIREMTTTVPPSTNKNKTNRPSIMSRLGEPVTDVNKGRRRSPTPDAIVGKSPKKKKDKKEKRKKSKKDKKEKKKGGGSAKPSDDTHNNPSDDDDDEELFKFFEEEKEGTGEVPQQQDELMKRMEKKNQARLKRLKEIEEDKMLHT